MQDTSGVDTQITPVAIHRGVARDLFAVVAFTPGFARSAGAHQGAPTGTGATPRSDDPVRARSRARFHAPASAPWGCSRSMDPLAGRPPSADAGSAPAGGFGGLAPRPRTPQRSAGVLRDRRGSGAPPSPAPLWVQRVCWLLTLKGQEPAVDRPRIGPQRLAPQRLGPASGSRRSRARYAAQSFISRRRRSNRSVRRYAASTRLRTLCASAASATSGG